MKYSLRNLLTGILRSLFVLTLLALVAIGFVCSLVVLQGQRDDAQPVQAIVVLSPQAAAGEHLDHALSLHQRGYGARLVVVGENSEEVRNNLVNDAGLPEAIVMALEVTGTRNNRLREVSSALHAEGVNRVLLVDSPDQMLLNLKMAGDLGLNAYGSPVATDSTDLQRIWQAGLAYWSYVLIGSA